MSIKFDLKAILRRKDLEGKVIFWDIDGTLAPYRFNGHVGDPTNSSNNGQSALEIEEGIFFERQPSKFMQRLLSDCGARKHIIMGHCSAQKEIDDKHRWLDIHYPMIKERLIIFENTSKAQTILKYCRENQISLDEVLYIDDVISLLREAERCGISAWHISSLMDYFI